MEPRILEIKDIATRALLKHLIPLEMLSSADGSDRSVFHQTGTDHDMRSVGFKATQKELRAELALRPHIPNKRESKKIRQEAARRKT